MSHLKLMSNMHNFTDSENKLKDILFHSLYLLAQHHKMAQEDAILYIEDDCALLDWFYEKKESA